MNAMTTSKRAKQSLTSQEKWTIAKYCIESKIVIQGKDGKFTHWRVKGKLAYDELNQWNKEENMGLPPVTDYRIKESVNFYNEIADLTNNLPAVPAVQETMEMDMLKVEISKLKAQVEQQAETIKGMQSYAVKCDTVIANYKERFSQIRKLATT